MAWTGVAVGAALLAICPPAGAAAVAAGAGIGAWVGHFWNQIPEEQIGELGDLLESGESAVFVVTVIPKRTDLEPLLMHPEIKQAETDQAARDKAAASAS